MQNLIGKSLKIALKSLSDEHRNVIVKKNDSKGDNTFDDELVVQIKETEDDIILVTSKFKLKV